MNATQHRTFSSMCFFVRCCVCVLVAAPLQRPKTEAKKHKKKLCLAYKKRENWIFCSDSSLCFISYIRR